MAENPSGKRGRKRPPKMKLLCIQAGLLKLNFMLYTKAHDDSPAIMDDVIQTLDSFQKECCVKEISQADVCVAAKDTKQDISVSADRGDSRVQAYEAVLDRFISMACPETGGIDPAVFCAEARQMRNQNYGFLHSASEPPPIDEELVRSVAEFNNLLEEYIRSQC